MGAPRGHCVALSEKGERPDFFGSWMDVFRSGFGGDSCLPPVGGALIFSDNHVRLVRSDLGWSEIEVGGMGVGLLIRITLLEAK
jgi:hypothetical protein